MLRIFILLSLASCVAKGYAQAYNVPSHPVGIVVSNEKNEVVEGATVEAFNSRDSTLLTTAVTNHLGKSQLQIQADSFYVVVSFIGYQQASTATYHLPVKNGEQITVGLTAAVAGLQNITIASRKALVQRVEGKVVVNVDASPTNSGTTVLEMLEKLPGVTADKNGTLSLQGKSGVLVMIDDKPTYLQGAELANLLGSLSASQVQQVELMTNPPAKYDAAGNAGIINVKTKKNKQEGFNIALSVAPGIGRYPKSNNSVAVNFRKGKFNSFLTYSLNYNKGYTYIYALRKYYTGSHTVASMLEQPSMLRSSSLTHTLKTGADYTLSPATILGVSATATLTNRNGNSATTAAWMDVNKSVDSSINTFSHTNLKLRNGWANISLKHTLSRQQEFSADVDAISYSIDNEQAFSNELQQTGGYRESTRGRLPSTIRILSAKADHTLRLGTEGRLETGYKVSHINTDNTAQYEYSSGSQWLDDLGKSNHFLYTEDINALYSSISQKGGRITLQAGLRYEDTRYQAHQLGNAVNKDSSFSRHYRNLFPSAFLSYRLDSANTLSLTAGRRIDRPAFQKLNPFVFIINKYTYQRGNPYFLPQYTWNAELSLQHKEWLTVTAAYSMIKNYFSQLFLTENNEILIYTEGNVGKMHNAGLSLSTQLSPVKAWLLTGQATANYKKLTGYVWNTFTSSVVQLHLNLTNQFTFGNHYTAELSGFYTTRARNDLQELLYPTGQIAIGIARPVLHQKGTVKLSLRDIFHTQVMEGLTQFEKADEYFMLRRDTRVATLAFTWRFGKQIKATKRSGGSAGDEIERANG